MGCLLPTRLEVPLPRRHRFLQKAGASRQALATLGAEAQGPVPQVQVSGGGTALWHVQETVCGTEEERDVTIHVNPCESPRSSLTVRTPASSDLEPCGLTGSGTVSFAKQRGLCAEGDLNREERK